MGCGAAAFVACAPAVQTKSRPRLAVTMDDFNLNFDKVFTPLERNARILEIFDRFDHKAAGFVTGRFVESETGDKVLRSWLEAGHHIGNHTYTHMNSTDEKAEVIKADILKNDRLLAAYKGTEKTFRFPFLAEGGEMDKVSLYRSFLEENGLRAAPVTIDSIDWYTTSRMEARLKDNAEADTSGYRDYYVQAVTDLARHYKKLADMLGYEDIPHQLLMHHNILNGLYLGDVMQALRDDGWDFVDAKEAIYHPFYDQKPNIPTRGRSLLSVLAQERGIENTGYPKRYYGFGEATMDSLGL
jgi:peptidoglycan/xylan/chitin deacetylase (PgdA/CDA1 family)